MPKARTADQKKADLRAAHPDRPWMWRDDFASGVIRADSGVEPVFLLIFSLFWGAGSFVGGWLGVREYWQTGQWYFLIALVFPLAGVPLLGWATRRFARWVRYRNSELRLNPTPAEIGGSLQAIIHVGPRIAPAEGFEVTLESLRRREDSDGDKHDSVLWQDVIRVPWPAPSDRNAATAIPITVPIPAECEPWNIENPRRQTIWRLRIAAKVVHAPDLDLSFDVPVFRLRPEDPRAEPLPDGFIRASGRAVPPSRTRVLIRPVIEGTEFVFPPAGGFGALVGFAISVAATAGIAWAISRAGAPFIFPLVVAFFGFFPTAAFLWSGAGEVRVLAGSNGVRMRYGLLGWRKEWRAGPGEVLEAGLSTTAPTGGRQQPWGLMLRRKKGSPWWVFVMLNGKEEADWVAQEINSRLPR